MTCYETTDHACDLERQERRDSIAYLMILHGAWTAEEIVIREGLQPRRLAHRQGADLSRVGVDEIVSVLGDVAGHGAGGAITHLDAEAIREIS